MGIQLLIFGFYLLFYTSVLVKNKFTPTIFLCLVYDTKLVVRLQFWMSWESGTLAEKISHFCLARNIIRPLGSTHNFTQSGWLILFLPDHLPGCTNWGNLPNTFFLAEQLRSVQTSHCLLFNSISSSINHHEGNYLIYGPLALGKSVLEARHNDDDCLLQGWLCY